MKTISPARILYTVIIFIFLYFPVTVLVVYSFNGSSIDTSWKGFTLHWYQKLFSNEELMRSLKTSLITGTAATILAAMLGSMGAVGLYRMKIKGKSALDSLFYLPIIIPEVVMGISLLSLFSFFHLEPGILTLILSHATFCMSYVMIIVSARLKQMDPHLEEAARDLGAGSLQTLLYIMLPGILPAVVAGSLLAFSLSFDDVLVSYFVSGPGYTPLPVKIYSLMRTGVTPEINALSTIMILFSALITLTAEFIRIRSEIHKEF